MYYSKTTRGFYSVEINPVIPNDAVEITDEQWQELLNGQASGQVILANAEGYPYLAGAPGPTDEQKKADCKATASQLLQQTDWTTIPDVGNPNISNPYLINVQEFVTYRNALRVLAINPVTDPVWPVKPTDQWGTN